MPYIVVRYFPIKVQPIVEMWVVSIDSLQQQVRTYGVNKGRSAFSSGGGNPPPPMWTTSTCDPLGVSKYLPPSFLSPLPTLTLPPQVLTC